MKDYSEDNKNVNFCSCETFILKPNQLFDDRELEETAYRMIFIELLIFALIKLNIFFLCVNGDRWGKV